MGAGPRNPFDGFRFEFDPDQMDEAAKTVRDKLESMREAVESGLVNAQYTRVRVRYKDSQIGPDLPLAAFMAGEGLGLAVFGPLKLLLGNLVGKALLDVEFVHDADELVTKGREAYTHGELEAAEAHYRDALSRRRDDPAALYHLAVVLRVTGREDEASQCLRTAAMGPEGHPDVIRAAEMLDRLKGKRNL